MEQARKLTNTVYEATGTGIFSRGFALKDQIRRASISIASISILTNIAEGFERGGDTRSSYKTWPWLRDPAERSALNSTLL